MPELGRPQQARQGAAGQPGKQRLGLHPGGDLGNSGLRQNGWQIHGLNEKWMEKF
jgi:hypothetical protein